MKLCRFICDAKDIADFSAKLFKSVCEKWGVAYLDYQKVIGTRLTNLPSELTTEWWRTNPDGTNNEHPNQYMYDTMNTMLDKFIMEIF